MRASITEQIGEGLSRTWLLEKVFCDVQTAFQRVVIARTAQGISLFCDGERQSTEESQLLYHEALCVPAFLLAASSPRVLVIGSSEGVVSQLALTAGASHVDHVDIDAECVRLCAEYLPYGYAQADLARYENHQGSVHIHYVDGYTFVQETGARYDVIVIDLPDERAGDAQHNRLYGADFLASCRAILAPQGVVVTQAGCPTLWRNDTLIRVWRQFSATFPSVTYVGSDEHEWAFLVGYQHRLPSTVGYMQERLSTFGYSPLHVDEEYLQGAIIPPHSLRTLGMSNSA